jgi:hypothetical protein
MVDQVAHLVLADGIAHVQAQNVVDRARQCVGIEIGAQPAHEHETAPEFDFLPPFLAGRGGFDEGSPRPGRCAGRGFRP